MKRPLIKTLRRWNDWRETKTICKHGRHALVHANNATHSRLHYVCTPTGLCEKSIFRRFGLVPPTIPGGLCFTEGVQTKHSPGCGKELHDAKREECCRSGCGRGGVTLFLALFWWRRTTTRVCVCSGPDNKIGPLRKEEEGGVGAI